MKFVVDVLWAIVGGGATAFLLVEIARWRARRSVQRFAAGVIAKLRADCDSAVADAQRDLDRIFGEKKRAEKGDPN